MGDPSDLLDHLPRPWAWQQASTARAVAIAGKTTQQQALDDLRAGDSTIFDGFACDRDSKPRPGCFLAPAQRRFLDDRRREYLDLAQGVFLTELTLVALDEFTQPKRGLGGLAGALASTLLGAGALVLKLAMGGALGVIRAADEADAARKALLKLPDSAMLTPWSRAVDRGKQLALDALTGEAAARAETKLFVQLVADRAVLLFEHLRTQTGAEADDLQLTAQWKALNPAIQTPSAFNAMIVDQLAKFRASKLALLGVHKEANLTGGGSDPETGEILPINLGMFASRKLVWVRVIGHAPKLVVDRADLGGSPIAIAPNDDAPIVNTTLGETEVPAELEGLAVAQHLKIWGVAPLERRSPW